MSTPRPAARAGTMGAPRRVAKVGVTMGAPRLRVATPADLPALNAIERAEFTSHAISPRQMRFLVSNPRAVFLVAIRDHQLAGNAIALIRRSASGISARIYSLVVSPLHRGQRIGQILMVAILRRLDKAGVRRIYLEVEDSNLGAIRLYEKLGFRPIKPLRHYYGRGKHGVHMRLDVTKK